MTLIYNYMDLSADIKANEVELTIGYQSITIPIEELQNVIDLTKFVKDKESAKRYEEREILKPAAQEDILPCITDLAKINIPEVT